ncbi:hypothetical protein OUY22_00830 [Nonomuraea sp. MCN248]|uniref:Uncharacterized protein n=1 Tax=Nonomuraea corallina TaxID=2989783 RepID=A0ABT4S419_9ACTN|nr:hypothetical protein [Nonomuraea corallina]MDA0631944.1 hypothetical protein [Nonomuraea corallina]
MARSREGVQDETRYAELIHELVERLTLPDIFSEQEIHDLVDAAVRRSLDGA